jgi:hypothetical protein
MKRLGEAITGMLLLLSIAACWGGGSKDPESTSVSEQTTERSLKPIFGTRTFDKPVGLERRSAYEDLLYVIEQSGRIVSMNLKHPSNKPTLAIDITDRVYDEGDEQGLLGLAFHPKHPNQAYVNYTTKTHTVIARYDADPNHPERIDPASEQVLRPSNSLMPTTMAGSLPLGQTVIFTSRRATAGAAGVRTITVRI